MSERKQKWLALLIGSILGVILGLFVINVIEVCGCRPQPTPTPTPPKDEVIVRVTPPPAATPTPVPHVPGPDTSGPPAEYHPPTCNGVYPTAPVCIEGYFTGPDSAYLGWWIYPDTADKMMLHYGYSPDNLEFGIDSIPLDSEGIEVHSVDTSGHIYYQVAVERNKCVVKSQICDP